MNSAYKKFKIPFIPLYLIRWKPNITSCIHGHKGKECNYLVLKGALKETIYKHSHGKGYYAVKTHIVNKNQSSHINDIIGEHAVKNITDEDAWSLHYYGKN